MLDIGFWELAVIGVVTLLVVGPERMPMMVKTAGQWAGRIQRVARQLRYDLEREATTQEFRSLNKDFMDEDQRLKKAARDLSAAQIPANPEASKEAGQEPAPELSTGEKP